MSRGRNRNKRKLESQINVVPYIDVMLVLLIIFMVTTPLLKQGVKVDLPNAHAKRLSTKDMQPVIITVNRSGKYFVNLQKGNGYVSHDNLGKVVSGFLKKNSKRDVLVRGDKDVNYGKVVEAMVLLQRGGVDKVGLMTEAR